MAAAARFVVLESGVSRMMVWKILAKRQEILSYDAKRINKFELKFRNLQIGTQKKKEVNSN